MFKAARITFHSRIMLSSTRWPHFPTYMGQPHLRINYVPLRDFVAEHNVCSRDISLDISTTLKIKNHLPLISSTLYSGFFEYEFDSKSITDKVQAKT
jgi:hypothetical protein